MKTFCLCLSTLVLCAPGAAIAAPGGFVVSIELIVDNDTPLPNAPEFNFVQANSQLMVNSGAGVMFSNSSIGPFQQTISGVYLWKNGNLNTLINSQVSPFIDHAPRGFSFQEMYSDGANAVVRASGPVDTDSGLYLVSADTNPQLIFERGSTLPDGAGAASDVFWPRVSGDNVLFTAFGDAGLGRVYRTDLNGNNVSTFLDENTPGVEGTGFFALGDFEDGFLSFRAFDFSVGKHTGVFTSDLDGNVTPIARLGDPLPGAPGRTVLSLGGDTIHPSISDGKIVYDAFGSDGVDGIYIAPVTGGASEVVVDGATILPGDNGLTNGFALPSISGDNVSFLGITAAGTTTGLWVSMGGTFVDIVHFNDEFDGRTVRRIFSSPFSMHENTVAFQIVFTNGDRGLYLATIIPTPGAAMVLAMTGLWAAKRRRRTNGV